MCWCWPLRTYRWRNASGVPLVNPRRPSRLLLLAAIPLEDEHFHSILLWLLSTSGLALTLGCLRHQDILVQSFETLGMALLITPVILGHTVLGEVGERLTTCLDSFTLIF